MADALSAERLAFMPSINHISAVYVTGIAGSGKSSSVIQMGLKLAVEILEDSGYMNAVLPVATFESQIEIVSKSVGKLSKGMEGMSVDNLHKMLKLAVIEQDEDAIATLSAIGIAIDEATYVQAVTVVNDDMVELESIDDLKEVQ
jgi:cytidylate kinase